MTHRIRRLVAVLGGMTLAGCDAEAVLGSAEQMWLWLIVPMFGFLLVGATVVYVRRRRQLDLWDLRDDPTEPTVKWILMATIGIGLVLATIFTIYNLRLTIDPLQKMWNIGLWFAGTILGTSVALLLGFTRAEP